MALLGGAAGALRQEGMGNWRAGAAALLLLCVCLCSLPSSCLGALPFGANLTALPLSQRLLYTCNGTVISYTADPKVTRIFPISPSNKTQPYRFKSNFTLTNVGYHDLEDWELWIGFSHGEVLADAPGLILSDGREKTPGALVGNGTAISSSENPDLLTSIATAEDFTLIQVNLSITGTEFGVAPGQKVQIPLPNNITLLNDGYKCGPLQKESNKTLAVCCKEKNSTTKPLTKIRPRLKGDITILYDVVSSWDTNYDAKVTMEMSEPIGRIAHWNLTWDWRYNEFIQSMKGAQTLEQGLEECLTGPIFKDNPGLDFTTVMSCQKTPTIVDLSIDAAFDPSNPPGCCRNGSLLPPSIDPKATKSVFTLTVMKNKKQKGRELLTPPSNWRIGDLGKVGADQYKCGLPRLVEPSHFDGPGLHVSDAFKTWQVTCNKTVALKAPRKCCVSFSGFYNTSVIPCPTCACGGCESLTQGSKPQCNPNIDPMLLPTYSLLLPPSNRTRIADDLARIERWPVPTPRPCPDNCGVAINWHIYSDFTNGFSSRLTVFNWDEEAVPNWFMAIELNKTVMPAYLDTYSFNSSLVLDPDTATKSNNTVIFLHGKEGFNNFLLGLDKGLVPGKVQSLMSFDKRRTKATLDVIGGDGFPKRVWFNGDECALPEIYPMNGARRLSSTSTWITAVVAVAITLVVGFV
ncbi:hypothetical protein R1sor_003158 [Riccia sorocarpa]|uniref:COBRA C-terminal domain-containing protein n=1 Tax=Riccia sorocarpa TaxID=122646 RepID=A0ABD3H4X9_9MARC